MWNETFYLIETLFSFLMKSHGVALCVWHGAGASSELRLRCRAQPGHPSSASAPWCCCARASSRPRAHMGTVAACAPGMFLAPGGQIHSMQRDAMMHQQQRVGYQGQGLPTSSSPAPGSLLAPWWTGHFRVENMRIWYLWNKIWVTQTFSYFAFK